MAYSKDDVITLVKKTPTGTYDVYGQEIFTESTREVFCKVRSINRSEFYQARQMGLELEYMFETNPANYEGERIVEYDAFGNGSAERYAVTRTHRPSADVLEIYAQREVGRL